MSQSESTENNPQAKRLPRFYWEIDGNLHTLKVNRYARYGFRACVTKSFESPDAYALLILWDDQKDYEGLAQRLGTEMAMGHVQSATHTLYETYGECLAIHQKLNSVRDARIQVESWVVHTLETLMINY